MGWLQGDTNNIIVDAVLTDLGRQFLSRNDGSFSVVKFALGDDEVDYSIIEKYGRNVGKEKIEKNTPVLEAQTLGNLAQKFKLISISNPNLLRLPDLTLVSSAGSSTTSDLILMGTSSTTSAQITVSQRLQNEDTIAIELQDQAFIVELSNLFLQVSGTTFDTVDGRQRATYLLTRNAAINQSNGGAELSFTLNVKSLTTAMFNVYGTTQNKNQIRTFVKITGIQSGAVKEFEVRIDKSGT